MGSPAPPSGGMAQTSPGRGPIPLAKATDSEDVAWALSTAEAMYACGDKSDALKWLRRAAGAASESQANDRAFELAKAAAEFAARLGAGSTPPAAEFPSSKPFAIAQPHVRSTPPPLPSSHPPATSATSSRPPGQGESRRTGWRLALPASPRLPGADVPVQPPTPLSSPPPLDSVGHRLRNPIPIEEMTPPATAAATATIGFASVLESLPAPRDSAPTLSPEHSLRWQAQSLAQQGQGAPHGFGAAYDLDDPSEEESTSLGVAAYEAHARRASEAAPGLKSGDPALRPSQAVRVVVWRASDGVHVAPQGTRVAAISVDAILVALDPLADLSGWLTDK